MNPLKKIKNKTIFHELRDLRLYLYTQKAYSSKTHLHLVI